MLAAIQNQALEAWIARASKRLKPVVNVVLMGGKKINGRKRHILVDSIGNLLTVVVHRANIPDRDGAVFVLDDAASTFPRLEKIWVDQAYNGGIADEIYDDYGIILEIVAQPSDQQGFIVVPRRWVVERTFAWLGRYRRLSKDYERHAEYSESWVYLASIARMLRKLAPNEQEERPYIRRKRALETSNHFS